MSIDFSKITGWSTAKGIVKQVTNSAGKVIWKMHVDDETKYTITVTSNNASTYCKIEHNGVTYTNTTSFTANAGDIITCTVQSVGLAGYSQIIVNGVEVSKSDTPGTASYNYEVVADTSIALKTTTGTNGSYASINITEQ